MIKRTCAHLLEEYIELFSEPFSLKLRIIRILP